MVVALNVLVLDFFSALAEAGIVPSKLSPNYGYDGLGDRERTNFFPER